MQACNDAGRKGAVVAKDTLAKKSSGVSPENTFEYKIEQDYLQRKRNLCKKLALYDIEKGTDDFELRMWLIPSMWDPSILYILKGQDTTWTLFHYQFYTLRATDQYHYYDNPLVDSVVMESVMPQKTNWTTYIKNLQLDSLWSLKTESAITGKSFGVLDGHRYLLEFNKRGQYKYLFYTAPEYFQDRDINHKRFTEFKARLVDPIIYKGMRNP